MSVGIEFLIGGAAVIFVLVVWIGLLEWRLRRLTRGNDGTNIETHLATIARDYQNLEEFKKSVAARFDNIDTRVKGSMRGIGMIRFNPFAGSGASKPSFAAAFISENGDGLVISSLHARDSVSIFTKNIKSFTSEHELTAEETQALEKAKNSLHT